MVDVYVKLDEKHYTNNNALVSKLEKDNLEPGIKSTHKGLALVPS